MGWVAWRLVVPALLVDAACLAFDREQQLMEGCALCVVTRISLVPYAPKMQGGWC